MLYNSIGYSCTLQKFILLSGLRSVAVRFPKSSCLVIWPCATRFILSVVGSVCLFQLRTLFLTRLFSRRALTERKSLVCYCFFFFLTLVHNDEEVFIVDPFARQLRLQGLRVQDLVQLQVLGVAHSPGVRQQVGTVLRAMQHGVCHGRCLCHLSQGCFCVRSHVYACSDC